MIALLLSLFIYATVGFSILGWGIVFGRLLKLRTTEPAAWPDTAWLGLGLALLALQLIHLVVPVQASFSMVMIAVGLILGARSLVPELTRTFQGRPEAQRLALLASTGILLAASWIALRSITQVPDDVDAGGYHFSTIRWIRSFPIVPGLGNLHFRLAFNSAFFLLVAALDFEPLMRHGHQMANSFLLVLTILTVVAHALPWILKPSRLLAAHPFRYGAFLFAIPPLGYVAMSRNFANPSPDLASTILQVAVFLLLLDGMGQWIDGRRSMELRATVIFLLSAALVATKLSNLAFAVGVSVFPVAYMLRTKASPASIVRITAPAVIILLTWSIRGFLLSGAPFFPSPIGYIPTWWAVSRDVLFEQSQWIRSWARAPTEPWDQVLASWDWFQPWLEQRSGDFLGMVYPLGISGILCLATMALAIVRRQREPSLLEWAVLTPLLAGLGFWFVVAPDIRFANALFFLTSMASCLLLLVSMRSLLGHRAHAAAFILLFLVGSFHFVQFAVANKWALKPCATFGNWVSCIPSAVWRQIPEVPLVTRTTLSGLVVYTPAFGGSCWDAPLPCTQPGAFDPELRLAKPGELSSGFTLQIP